LFWPAVLDCLALLSVNHVCLVQVASRNSELFTLTVLAPDAEWAAGGAKSEVKERALRRIAASFMLLK